MAANFPNFQDGSHFSGFSSLREEMLAELERLREIMRGDYKLEDDEDYKKLSDEEREIFHDFLEFYGNCPICKVKNHDDSLKKFYFSMVPENIRLRDQLLNIMEGFNPDNKYAVNKVKLGIPCCNCYKLLFEEPGIIGIRM